MSTLRPVSRTSRTTCGARAFSSRMPIVMARPRSHNGQWRQRRYTRDVSGDAMTLLRIVMLSALGVAAATAALLAQTPAGVDGHVAAARTAAGSDFIPLFNR